MTLIMIGMISKLNHAWCKVSRSNFCKLQNQMLDAIKGVSKSNKNGLFINSCFAHCQSERQDTWFADDSPMIQDKSVALSRGDWFFDRVGVSAIDCPYPRDNTRHNLVFK
ncbi:hypothetical protein Scep_030146 [Stephania cephalantha]|uniref:Pectin acetylesterase n=1 Tax=Stephania cephalantha TaxID=152367 RepID=A0AAP0E1X2_9MAGN